MRIKAKVVKPEEIPISTDFIKLDQLLKFSNIVESGGMAKELIEAGEVSVNGEKCLMRGKKLRAGDTVICAGRAVKVV
ncbi:MAG: RNA-binding S4 domain-containing protein [Oscillospiraceae bacterium]|nr:RNA-binding S4 domain-containing protein [Oscillospiraceae bacterium]